MSNTEIIKVRDNVNNGNANVKQQTYGWNVYYGRRIDDGMYTIGGTTYVLKNSGDQQSWFILNADKTQTKVDVELFKSNSSLGQTVYYYRFGNIWYKYINHNFAYFGVTPPPFYTGSATYSVPVTKAPVTTYSNIYNALPQTQIVQYSSQNSGSKSSSSSVFYKQVVPVTSSVPQVTVTETKTQSASNFSSEKMVKSIPSAAEVPNADAALFNW
jgi:hypothetical protein